MKNIYILTINKDILGVFSTFKNAFDISLNFIGEDYFFNIVEKNEEGNYIFKPIEGNYNSCKKEFKNLIELIDIYDHDNIARIEKFEVNKHTKLYGNN